MGEGQDDVAFPSADFLEHLLDLAEFLGSAGALGGAHGLVERDGGELAVELFELVQEAANIVVQEQVHRVAVVAVQVDEGLETALRTAIIAAYRANAQVAWFPASARWHVFSASLRFQVSRFRSTVSRFRFQHFPSSLMYAGFKRIAPAQDTGMDLNDPWISALGLFITGKHS